MPGKNYMNKVPQIETEDESEDYCDHTNCSNYDGSIVCMDCGSKLNETLLDNETRYYGAADTRYTSDPGRHNQRKNEERSLYSDLEPLGFPQEIIEQANRYYKKIIEDRIYRATNRMSIVFACTYHAYEDRKEHRDPQELAKQFHLSRKGVSNGFKTFSSVFRNRTDKKYIDAMDLVPQILTGLGLDTSTRNTATQDIKYIYDIVCSRSKIFNSSNPKSIAAGLVYYYLKINDNRITRAQFFNVVKLTDITFTNIAIDIHRELGYKKEIKF
jgi:transcription initiation factor TFIIIB Brf1 subunit/transcription initiation factor TFIIB